MNNRHIPSYILVIHKGHTALLYVVVQIFMVSVFGWDVQLFAHWGNNLQKR